MDRNVELTVEDILSIHRHWVTKLYVQDHKTEEDIVSLLHEARLPVTMSQIQNCLSEWGVTSSTSLSRRCSLASSLDSESTDADWDAIRCPSPASSTSSHYSTSPEHVELYSRRPLPSLPSPRAVPTLSHSNPSRSDVHTIATPCNNSPSLLTKVTSHQTKTRSYEVEKTLSIFSKGPSPLDLFASSMQSHECIAVGLRRIKIEYPNDTSFDHDDEFEWMRQFKEYKTFNTERREVRILQDGDEA
ncbi:hypothetical protein GLAREA_08549 [Glarea lozoyensis ATCC 20868]|uniref:Clr5 domain-containing protein n=1 Tax=Glarea lozoyensis (strain ATCC 20868 / MF5171) TaxID=1116229 RepID=S3CXY4_GLAL2|nr:uncharacterized protein GLAREA_08549 [Glarea lozoyensis ATCC 20868]EPE24696.1 hypothetical protein GLAREA_08549 [Glarea lozoyensis ATCC 20868]